MREILGSVFVSLDGVIQAPGGPDEDRTGEFDLLLGRRTYDIFAACCPNATGQGNALGERLNRAGKYVVTGGTQSR